MFSLDDNAAIDTSLHRLAKGETERYGELTEKLMPWVSEFAHALGDRLGGNRKEWQRECEQKLYDELAAIACSEREPKWSAIQAAFEAWSEKLGATALPARNRGEHIADKATPGAMDNAILHEESARAKAALEELPTQQHNALNAVYLQGQSADEHAGNTGQNPSDINWALAQGQKALRSSLSPKTPYSPVQLKELRQLGQWQRTRDADNERNKLYAKLTSKQDELRSLFPQGRCGINVGGWYYGPFPGEEGQAIKLLLKPETVTSIREADMIVDGVNAFADRMIRDYDGAWPARQVLLNEMRGCAQELLALVYQYKDLGQKKSR